jgi:hypothetical protein
VYSNFRALFAPIIIVSELNVQVFDVIWLCGNYFKIEFILKSKTYKKLDHFKVLNQRKIQKMNKSIRLAVALAVGTGAGLAQADETVYCVHDDGLNDSQFCYVNLNPPNPPKIPGLQVLPLKVNPLTGASHTYWDCDIEALDISHPNQSDLDNLLFAASGDDTPRKGHLYFVETDNLVGVRGDLFDLGNVVAPPLNAKVPLKDVKEIDAISFHPNTDNLWGWAQDRGLFVIPSASIPLQGAQVISTCQEPMNPEEIQAEMVIVKQMEVEAITWNQNGTILYGVKNCHNDDPDSHGKDENGWPYPNPRDYDFDCGIELWAGNWDPGPADPVFNWEQVCPNITADIEDMLAQSYPNAKEKRVAEIEALESLPRHLAAPPPIPPGDDLVVIGFHGPHHLLYAMVNIPPPPALCGFRFVNDIDSKPFNDIEGLAYSPENKPD